MLPDFDTTPAPLPLPLWTGAEACGEFRIGPEALDRLNALLGTGRATTNPEEIVTAACSSQIAAILRY